MPFFRFVLILPFLLLAALAACSRTPASRPASSNTPAASTAPVAAMPAHPTTSAAPSPVTGAATSTDATGATAGGAAPTAVRTATGVVTETMDAADYTYVRLDTGTEQIWAATSKTKVKVGDRLAVPLETPMRNFHSEKLGRDFPLIYFASAVSRGDASPSAVATGGGQPMPARQAMPPGHPPVGAGAAAAPIKVTEVIPPAAGGRSVAGIWAERTALTGKTVIVRGKVVKFLSGIMDRNWLHLQDGTGDLGDGTNDITVTTDAEAKPGDIVTAKGTLAVDKDFGAGYHYGAIVEDATISKEGGSQ